MLDFSGITLTKGDATQSTASFAIGPFPKGYGYTVGNALRRIMLSSLGGAAITSVRVNNVAHEYGTLPGVKQNILDIVLKLKNVRVKMEGDEAVVLTLNAKGKGVVTAGDIKTPKGVEIVNADFEIAEITDKSASLTIEAIVENGIGYKKADESLRDEIGRIPLDTLFSPVKLVDFTVSPTRKGDKADLDKIEISITTDGTKTPEEALADAGAIFRDLGAHLSIVFGNSAVATEVVEEEPVVKENTMDDWRLEEIGLSAALMKKLTPAGVETLSMAASKTEEFYRKEAKLTEKQTETLSKLLDQYNLTFSKDA